MKCAYKFYYLGECVDECPDDYFVNEELACTPCSEYPDKCILEPLSYTVHPFVEDYKLHAYVIFNRVVDLSITEFVEIVQIQYNGQTVKAS